MASGCAGKGELSTCKIRRSTRTSKPPVQVHPFFRSLHSLSSFGRDGIHEQDMIPAHSGGAGRQPVGLALVRSRRGMTLRGPLRRDRRGMAGQFTTRRASIRAGPDTPGLDLWLWIDFALKISEVRVKGLKPPRLAAPEPKIHESALISTRWKNDFARHTVNMP